MLSDKEVRLWLVSQLKALCGWTPPQGEDETIQVQQKVLSSKRTDFSSYCSSASLMKSSTSGSLQYLKLFITQTTQTKAALVWGEWGVC